LINEKYPEFYLSQTAVKDLEDDQTCPSRWRAQWLLKQIPFASNEHMDKGSYFEYLALGGGATAQAVTDLPRLGNGSKSAEHKRIEQQMERFKRMFDPTAKEFRGLMIIDRQVEIKDNKNRRKGTIDFVTKDLETDEIWINDLKLTADATSTRSKYGWGHSWDKLDMLQMVHYQDLYAGKHGPARAALWVFDYSTQMRVKIGEIKISDKAKQEKDIRFDSAIEVIDMYEDRGWSTIPSEEECKGCPLKCADRWTPPAIEIFTVNV
jgi:hypothetical protein